MAAKKRKGFAASDQNHKSSRLESKKVRKSSTANDLVYYIAVFTIAITAGVLHRNHVSKMFENDKHFSHLSTLERELSFRTEMGLYYSYYKTMVDSPTLKDGLMDIMMDNVTEYPQVINTLKRFNLYPEILLAVGYRSYEAVNAFFQRETKQCWRVNRGEGLSPVDSCEGLGEPSYFYVESVFALHGIMMFVFFLFGVYFSDSIFGGILAVTAFFCNHGECTRVHWTPPLRESFAFPFFIMEMFIVTHVLRTNRPMWRHSLIVAIAATLFMIPWQFAQFALMTQTMSVFATYMLNFIGSRKLKVIVFGQLLGWLISWTLLFMNEMLLTSFYFSCLITVLVIMFLEPLLVKLRLRILIMFTQGCLLLTGTVGFKILIGKVLKIADDAHIGDLLLTKFTNFKNFHTMLYTCAVEFDFMEAETPIRVLKTLLAPGVLVSVLAIIILVVYQEWLSWKRKKSAKGKSDDIREDKSKPYAELVYHIFQLLAFTAMAVLIMRLKLFWTPHLCLMTSLLAYRQLFGWVGNKERHFALLALYLAGTMYQGYKNISHQLSIVDAVFAGAMPTMATVKLCTKRPIVNHPHYEDVGLRERTMKVYSMYSRKPVKDVKKNLVDLHVDYAILEGSWCRKRPREGCAMPEIWDLSDKVNQNKKPVCLTLNENAEPYFKTVYRNEVYTVLKVQ
ncbi:probable C-mannosyltransferase DPY19L1 [Octopus vulgaris]|uniref:Probable C-mannosyltransferase DPY19L1 n=1 Tax=Octopus vulgaris TaxID=6645 RepID=A0AA36BX88_OCTVU|nr:probable C-mannosyltransferase DPY19L1 [Octopus vulgaris]